MENKKINKQELISKIATDCRVSKSEVKHILESFESIVKNAIKNDESISIHGFGTLKTQEVKAKKGRIVKLGKEIEIPAHKRIKFIPGSELKKAIE